MEVYSFDGRAKLRRGVEGWWYVDRRPATPVMGLADGSLATLGPFDGAELELRLARLQEHREVTVTFLFIGPPEALRMSANDGRRWTVLEPIALPPEAVAASPDGARRLAFEMAAGRETWLVEAKLPHSAATLRLRWSAPGAEWSIAQVRVSVSGDAKIADLTVDGSRRRAVVFCATDGVPSHGFVIFEWEDAGRRRTSASAWGFYPEAQANYASLALGLSAPGELRDEFRTGQMTRVAARLVVYADARRFAAARAGLARWRRERTYRLLTRDCVTLLEEVAGELGLRVPRRGVDSLRPAAYLEALIEAN